MSLNTIAFKCVVKALKIQGLKFDSSEFFCRMLRRYWSMAGGTRLPLPLSQCSLTFFESV